MNYLDIKYTVCSEIQFGIHPYSIFYIQPIYLSKLLKHLNVEKIYIFENSKTQQPTYRFNLLYIEHTFFCGEGTLQVV